MSRVTKRVLLPALLLLLPTAAWAQPAPWEQERAKKETHRVLVRIQQVVNTSARQDGTAAVRALTDSNWILRMVGAVRLETLGLHTGVARGLKALAAPDKAPPRAKDPLVHQASKFAGTVEQPPAGTQFPTISIAECMRILTSVVSERVWNGPEKPLAKRKLMETILPCRYAVKKGPQAWLAMTLLGLTDTRQALKDLKKQNPRKAVGKDGAAVYTWYKANARYLYWHPTQRRFRVDLQARKNTTASAEYRKKNPWGADEGPNKRAKDPKRPQ